jgi:peptidoglycan hydrolase CwlO-like protein
MRKWIIIAIVVIALIIITVLINRHNKKKKLVEMYYNGLVKAGFSYDNKDEKLKDISKKYSLSQLMKIDMNSIKML